VATLVAYNVVMVTIGVIANRMSRDDGDYFYGSIRRDAMTRQVGELSQQLRGDRR
jgi:hypothetical protein